MMPPALRFALLPASLLLLLLLLPAGCGSTGAPQPPSLKIPEAVVDLGVSRMADQVQLHWTMPKRATDRVLLAGDQRVCICRNERPGRCQEVGRVLLQPGMAAGYTDLLPSALSHGAPRLLTYSVELRSRSGRAAGPSNFAYTAAGSPPLEPEHVSAEASAKGIEVRFEPASAPATLIRLQRTRVLATGESPRPDTAETRAGVPQPLTQTLELSPRDEHPDHVIDADALLDRRYRYQVQRIVKFTLEGHAFEIGSAPGSAEVYARDLFPPAVPRGLAAVADNDARALDLSWSPNAERDLAGYFVYRRVVGSSEMVRVSGTAPLDTPAWRDAHAEEGRRYVYAVTAVDRDGNESPRSAETEEGLAPK